ncbi:hypothetical protein F5Y16DRAFT_243314 [Xylariaceae sp. FL0255]|nr:hypothetical protein F5Y16DRAFT_243314 [Xylariaceae sp. FL0255]
MIQGYLQTLRPILQFRGSSLPLQRAVLGVGTSPFRRSFTLQSLSKLRLPNSRIIQNPSHRPKLSSPIFRTYRSPLPRNKRLFHRTSRQQNSDPNLNPNPKTPPKEEPQGLSARLRKLSREYGWAAVGVYLGLSVLDFPFCFLLVRWVGTERIGELEHLVVSNVSKVIPESIRNRWNEYRTALKKAERENIGNGEISEHVEMAGWGVAEADHRNNTEASLGTQLALAYAIHKSFIFIRVPLTAAVTPKVVKTLRSWGISIGKRRPKA